ncbi:MAG: MFS transporter, partial [Alphaproteobacteria bacterium]|nr:MFS transporter [Alphaproteobacteria bacterium]
MIGALFFGWLAERYGRMPAMIWSIALFAVMSLACAQAWDYNSLLVFRFIQGIGLGGEVPIAATYISEIARARGRGRFVLLYELIFPVGIVAAALVGRWLVPTYGWQAMFYVGALPAVLALVLRILLPESPRWLASRGRMQESDAAMLQIEREVEKAAGKPLPPPSQIAAPPPQRASLSDLFGPHYLKRTLVLWVIWFSAYYINYGLTVWLPSLYTRVLKMPLAEALTYNMYGTIAGLFGAFLCAMLIDMVGRKLWIMACFFIGAIPLAWLWSTGVTSAQQLLIAAAIMQMTIGSICLAVYVYSPESYPTRA